MCLQVEMLCTLLGAQWDAGTEALWYLMNEFFFFYFAGEKGVRVELNKPSDSISKDVL